jgi:hypothetical protein
MEALQMLKFNFKKSRLNFMSDWQSVPVPDDKEDWLRLLATTTDEAERVEAMDALTESFEMGDTPTYMPEDTNA